MLVSNKLGLNRPLYPRGTVSPYEIRKEKDHLMSNFKMLLINLSSHAQRRFFPEVVHNFTMDSMMKAFYQQDGYVKIKKKRIDVALHSYDNPFLQKAVEYAC